MENIESVRKPQAETKSFCLPHFLIIILMFFAFLLVGYYTGVRCGIEKASEAAVEYLEIQAADPHEIDLSLIDSQPAAVYGDESASTVKVFIDLQCPSCSTFLETSLKDLSRNPAYRLEFYDLPSENHAYSRLAAAYARCAVSQGIDYLTYTGNLHDDFSEWTSMLKESNAAEYLLQTSLKYGSDEDEMNRCVLSEDVYTDIDGNIADAAEIGVSGTPSFIIGSHMVSGSVSPKTFISMLNEFGS